MPTAIAIRFLSIMTLLADLLAIFVVLACCFPPLKKSLFAQKLINFIADRQISFALVLAAFASAGTFFFSEIAKFAPCLLCWWQRFLLYPQVILLSIALWRPNPWIKNILILLCFAGLIISGYHNYLQINNPPSENFCTINESGVDCRLRYFVDFGYITIPMMSFTVFAWLILLITIKRPK